MKQLSIRSLNEKLSEIVGDDLADSLIKAASERQDAAMNAYMLSADGLDDLSSQQRQDVLKLLDQFSS